MQLTFIETSPALSGTAKLYNLYPALEPREQEWRIIYTSPQLKTWIETDLPNLDSIWKVEVSPLQQLDALVDEFCSGCTLCFGPTLSQLPMFRVAFGNLKLQICGFLVGFMQRTASSDTGPNTLIS
jgi:hypothetical protein